MSIRHLAKLEVWRSNVTGTWVRTLATCTAGEAEAGMVVVTRVPAVVEWEAGREGEVREELVEAPVPAMARGRRSGRMAVVW